MNDADSVLCDALLPDLCERDDLSTLPLSPEMKKYARITSRDIEKKYGMHVDIIHQLLNKAAGRPKRGFVNSDEGETVSMAK